jgi:membrane protein YqaA with SNARE-associated domain
MTERVLETLGVYGGSFVVAFIAGLFPLFSIELFLIGLSAVTVPSFEVMARCCLVAAVGHQIAKTICYYAGVGALEHGRLKAKLDKHRHRIDRWNKAPYLIMVLGATIGIPPLYILGFIARPLMGMRFWRYTGIVFVGRVGRFMVLAAIPLLVNGCRR